MMPGEDTDNEITDLRPLVQENHNALGQAHAASLWKPTSVLARPSWSERRDWNDADPVRTPVVVATACQHDECGWLAVAFMVNLVGHP